MLLRRVKHRQSQALLILAIVCLLAGKLFAVQPSFLGYRIYMVNSSSMHPAYPKNTLIVIKDADFNQLKIGDVIAFKSTALNGRLAFHRIVQQAENGFITKGDANQNADNQTIDQTAYVGKCVLKTTFFANYLTAISSPLGFTLFLIIPIAMVSTLVLLIRQLKQYRL